MVLGGLARADEVSLERNDSDQEGSSEGKSSLRRSMFCEGFARADGGSLERTHQSQEGSSEEIKWLERPTLWKGFARAYNGSLELCGFCDAPDEVGSSELEGWLEPTKF